MESANLLPINANGGDLSCYCAIIRLFKDWNEIVGSVMHWQIGDELVDWSCIAHGLVNWLRIPRNSLFESSSVETLRSLHVVRLFLYY